MPSINAIIDMGTNTFHLLIASFDETGCRIVHRESIAVKIGEGTINTQVIDEAGIQRAIAALNKFQRVIREKAVRKTFAFGTSAIRSAKNRDEVVDRLRNATGIDTRIITGDQEAEFIYSGINAALELGIRKSLIIDIGGGSVEFIIANNAGVDWKKSYDIGGQRLLERFQKHDRISQEEIATINRFFDDVLGTLFIALNEYKPETLIGSSGTFDTLSEIYSIQEGIRLEAHQPETALTFNAFNDIYSELITMNRSQRMEMPGMIEMRVDMIVVACCLIHYLIDHYKFRDIRVSSWSLKEGVLHCLQQGLL